MPVSRSLNFSVAAAQVRTTSNKSKEGSIALTNLPTRRLRILIDEEDVFRHEMMTHALSHPLLDLIDCDPFLLRV